MNKAIDVSKEANLALVLKQLLEQTNMSANALAKKINLPTPTIHRLLTGEVQDPRASTLIEIANYFGVTIDQLLGRIALKENTLNSKKENKLIIKPPLSIPILSLNEATQCETYFHKATDWIRWQANSRDNDSLKNKIFAVKIKNKLYEPLFLQDALVIINPEISPVSGDYVLVSFTGDLMATIKKYIAEGHYKYLYPLQSEMKTINFDKKCHIIGIIIASYIIFKE